MPVIQRGVVMADFDARVLRAFVGAVVTSERIEIGSTWSPHRSLYSLEPLALLRSEKSRRHLTQTALQRSTALVRRKRHGELSIVDIVSPLHDIPCPDFDFDATRRSRSPWGLSYR